MIFRSVDRWWGNAFHLLPRSRGKAPTDRYRWAISLGVMLSMKNRVRDVAARLAERPPVAEPRLIRTNGKCFVLGACRTWEASAAKRPQRSIFHRLFVP